MSQNYSATTRSADGIETVHLTDLESAAEVSIVPSIGNNAYEMKVNGADVLWSPYKSVAEFKAHPQFLGVPFLAPWANRLDGDAFWTNGRQHALNPGLGNLRRDQFGHPIHGLLFYSDAWKVISIGADAASAWVTSHLDFAANPAWLAQFPFPHTIAMTYRLAGGVLEVNLTFNNHATEPMPLVIGFHPYFTIPGVPPYRWRVHIAAEEQVTLSPQFAPTGDRAPVTLADPLPLQGLALDDVFTSLRRDSRGRAKFSVEGDGRVIEVTFGPKYIVAVIYAPRDKEFICFEPMTGVTNGFNLNHGGKYADLQSVAPGGQWSESFWIGTEGY